MNYSEYLQLKKDIENEYRKNLDALELVWKRSQNVLSRTQQGNKIETPGVDQPLSEAVRLVIAQMDKDFTADLIEIGLSDHNYNEGKPVNRVSLTNTLHRLWRRGELELVKKGRGRTPSAYRRKPSENNNPS